MTADNWTRIRDHLIGQGYMTEDGVTRKIQARTCPDCHAPILAGLDGDLCARDCRVDPDPVSPLGEAVATLTGRYTRTLRRLGGRWQLGARSPLMIRGTPAGAGRYDVLAEHRCGQPLPRAESVHAVTTLDPDTLREGAPCPF